MEESHQLWFIGCSTRPCLSEGKGSSMGVLIQNSTFTLVIFYFYLELVIVSVNICCTCIVVYMCIILLESIQGLWRYTQRKLNLKGYFYKGIIKGVRWHIWKDLMYWLHCMWQRCTTDRMFVLGIDDVVIIEIEKGIESYNVEIWHVEVKGVLSEESISPFLSDFACVYWDYCRTEINHCCNVIVGLRSLRYIRNQNRSRSGTYGDILSWRKIHLYKGIFLI